MKYRMLRLKVVRDMYWRMRRIVVGRIMKSINSEDFPDNKKAARMFTHVINRIIRPIHHSFFWGDRLLSLDKSQSFLEDKRFKKTFEEIRGSHLYDQYGGEHTIAWRLNTLVWAARCGLSLDGDFVECGTFKGDMAWVIVKTLEFGDLDNRTFYLYDSFEGFSRELSSEEDFPSSPGFFEFTDRAYKIPELYENVVKRFEGIENVKITKGFLPDSLHDNSPEKIAFLHIDLNSAAPEIGVLKLLFDRVVSGGIIVFEDYGWLMHEKQRETEYIFMCERGYDVLELPTGQGLVIKR